MQHAQFGGLTDRRSEASRAGSRPFRFRQSDSAFLAGSHHGVLQWQVSSFPSTKSKQAISSHGQPVDIQPTHTKENFTNFNYI